MVNTGNSYLQRIKLFENELYVWEIIFLHCMTFMWHLTYNSRGAWHTLNCKCDDAINMLP